MVDIAADTQIPQHPVTADELLALAPGDDEAFERIARRVYEAQIERSPAYAIFAEGHSWSDWRSAPFIPVEVFKWPGVTGVEEGIAEAVFLSSATGGTRSRHPVLSIDLYEAVAGAWFEACVGSGPFRLIAHLPTYESVGAAQSSLVHMVGALMRRLGDSRSEFVPDLERLRDVLEKSGSSETGGTRLVLFGTAFGLLELAESGGVVLPDDAIVIETGGMKTDRREIDRTTLHLVLASSFGLPTTSIRSEYGMCELLSQMYTCGGEAFAAPPWVRYLVVDPDDPARELPPGQVGSLAIFDLANCHSISALLTSDLAVVADEGLEIIGRATGAELRGCNFLMEGSS